MSDQGDLLVAALTAVLKPIVEEAVKEAMAARQQDDRLIGIEEAATLLGLSTDWLYRNQAKLPFARRIGPKLLRFSTVGLQKWLESRR